MTYKTHGFQGVIKLIKWETKDNMCLTDPSVDGPDLYPTWLALSQLPSWTLASQLPGDQGT